MTQTTIKAMLLGFTALAAVPAFAQAGPARSGSTDAQAGDQGLAAATSDTVDDIVVTARKSQERLQDVPLAITAFSSQDIKSARIEGLNDLSKVAVGLNFTPLFGRQNQLPIIRGAAQTLGPLNVGVFLDGIYLSGKAGADLELNDLERIEVVEGPQSALYGRNTFAGAINYITKRPGERLAGQIEATYGTHSLFKSIVGLSGPITENVGFRVGGFYRKFNGWYRSAIDGGRVDFEESFGGTGTIEFRPLDALTVTLRAAYNENDDGQPPSSVIRNNSAPGTPASSAVAPIPGVLPAGFTPTRNLLFIGELPSVPRNGVLVNTVTIPGQPADYGDREKAVRGSGTIEYDFGAATITSLTAYSHRTAEYVYDGDNTICDVTAGCPNFGFPLAAAIPNGRSVFALSANRGTYRDWSQELRIASSGKNRIDWLGGFFYYNNRTLTRDRGFSPLTNAAGVVTGFNSNYSYPTTIQRTRSYSGFGSVTFNATDQLALTGELRYEKDKQGYVQVPLYGFTPAGQSGAFTGSLTVFNLKQTTHFWTPRAIVKYQIAPTAQIYASFAKGAKEGGFNTGLNITADQRAFQPEKSNNYEIGFKSDLLDRHLRLNGDVYYIDWNNQQAACQNPVSAGGSSTNRTYTCNVATSEIYGAEVQATARFSGAFQINASYAYTHARYQSFIDDSLAQTLALAGRPAINFDGRHLPYVPDHKIVVSPQVHADAGEVGIDGRVDVLYQSRTYLRADNLQNFGDKTVVDLRLTARYQGLSLQLFVNNLLDNKRPVAGVRFFDSVNYSISSPLVQGAARRQIGGTLGYAF